MLHKICKQTDIKQYIIITYVITQKCSMLINRISSLFEANRTFQRYGFEDRSRHLFYFGKYNINNVLRVK